MTDNVFFNHVYGGGLSISFAGLGASYVIFSDVGEKASHLSIGELDFGLWSSEIHTVQIQILHKLQRADSGPWTTCRVYVVIGYMAG